MYQPDLTGDVSREEVHVAELARMPPRNARGVAHLRRAGVVGTHARDEADVVPVRVDDFEGGAPHRHLRGPDRRATPGDDARRIVERDAGRQFVADVVETGGIAGGAQGQGVVFIRTAENGHVGAQRLAVQSEQLFPAGPSLGHVRHAESRVVQSADESIWCHDVPPAFSDLLAREAVPGLGFGDGQRHVQRLLGDARRVADVHQLAVQLDDAVLEPADA